MTKTKRRPGRVYAGFMASAICFSAVTFPTLSSASENLDIGSLPDCNMSRPNTCADSFCAATHIQGPCKIPLADYGYDSINNPIAIPGFKPDLIAMTTDQSIVKIKYLSKPPVSGARQTAIYVALSCDSGSNTKVWGKWLGSTGSVETLKGTWLVCDAPLPTSASNPK